LWADAFGKAMQGRGFSYSGNQDEWHSLGSDGLTTVSVSMGDLIGPTD
jgi:hypothetical protein